MSEPVEPLASARWRFANVEYDELSAELRVDGRLVDVEPRPLKVLSELLRHVNEVVTRDELQDSVWDGRQTVDHVVANAVSKLRSVLGDAGAARIVTVPRIGYRLVGPVQASAARAPTTVLEAGREVPGRSGFVLERPLGDGSRSDVWLARHTKLGHAHVFKFADDGARLSALKREYTLYRVLRQELGPRDDIATVIDSNFISAPCFLECQYGGRGLPEWAASDSRLPAMSVAERLDLFLQIARAVAAAHSVGVLHKDLKPGNVLVDGEPGHWQVRLTDFGSGRLLDPSRLASLQLTALGMTQTQHAIPDSGSGTPLYLAPELLAGQAPTVQSDLYALGLILYQLVVGDLGHPLSTGWERDIADPLLREDIAAATEGRPEVRLKGVPELVERLATLDQRRAMVERQRVHEAASAEAAATLSRSRARRPWVLAAIGSLACGLVVSLAFGLQTRRALQQAQAESARATATSDFLHRDVIESTDIITIGATIKPQMMLETLRRASRAAASRFEGQPRVEAALRRRLAETFMKMASLADARQELTTAIALLAPISRSDDPEFLTARFLQARLLYWTELPADAFAVLVAAERDAGAPALAATSEVAFIAARARYEHFFNQKSYVEALPFAEQLVQLSSAIYSAGSEAQIDARQRLAEVHYNLGNPVRTKALLDEIAGPPFNAKGVTNEFYARQFMLSGQRQRAGRKYPGAEQALIEARDWTLKADKVNEFYLAFAELELASVFEAQGKLDLAAASLTTALAAFKKTVSEDHQYAQTTAIELAHVRAYQGRFAEALQLVDGVDRWQQQTYGKRPWSPLIDFSRAVALIGTGRAGEGLGILKTLDGAHVQVVSQWTDWQQRIDFHKGMAEVKLGRTTEGLASMRAAVASMERGDSWSWLAASYRKALEVESGSAPRLTARVGSP